MHPPLALRQLVQGTDNVVAVLVVGASVALEVANIENMSNGAEWHGEQVYRTSKQYIALCQKAWWACTTEPNTRGARYNERIT